MKVRLSRRAEADVIRQFRYNLADQDAPLVAVRFREAVNESIKQLELYPRLLPISGRGDILMLIKTRIRSMIEPAPTSPIGSFKWNDKRSIGKQIAGGFWKAGGLIGGFAIILVVLVGQGLLADQRALSRGSIVTYWAALIAAALIMIWTANRWAPFVTGFFFGPAGGKILGALAFGPDSSSRPISRIGLAVLLAYTLTVIALTMRFVGKRPAPTTALDRLALTFFVFATLNWVTNPHPSAPWSLLLGGFALFAAWCAHRWTSVKSTRGRRNDRRLMAN